MASTTNENYITETILVPLYNRSAGLRKLISRKFGSHVDFGSFIRFTGNNGKNSKDNKYGYPDATSDLGNIIEVKVNYAPLTDYEKKGGMEGNGYERFLNENPSNYLLYIVPDGYTDPFVESERSKILTWGKILDYIIEQNNQDPIISMICNKVEVEKKEIMRTFPSYKAKVYESLIKAMNINSKFFVLLNEESGLVNFPDEMDAGELNAISFRYNDELKNQYWLNFDRKGIFLSLPQEFNPFLVDSKEFFLDNDDWLKMYVVTQRDFWNFSSDKIAETIIKKLDKFINIYERIENDIDGTSKTYEDIFMPALRQFANDMGLKYEEDKDLKTFYFQKEGESWWYAFQFEDASWRNLVYGIYYDRGGKKRKNYEKVLENSLDDGGCWTSYKHFDEPYKDWGSKVFEEIQGNPQKFIEKHILPKIKEIDKALGA